MKRFRILHRTYYNFSAPVSLGRHELRLRPHESHELQIESSTLDIQPAGVVHWYRDMENNSVAAVTFSGESQQLAIVSDIVVRQYNLKPFDFLLTADAQNWPLRYSATETATLAPYLDNPNGPPDAALQRWLDDGAAQVRRNDGTIALLLQMGERIGSSLSYRIRNEPGVQTPATTLAYGSGSCRDFAALFIAAVRRLGFAARFVSGYLRADASTVDLGATHAWAEVYLPGAGWKGFDPTLMKLVGPEHFAVSVVRDPDSAPPVAGAFSGYAQSRLEVGVWVTELP